MQMAMEKYPLDWLKRSCEQVYCRTIAERTWRKWLRLCQVPRYAREIVKQQALWLLTLAYLKKPNPSKKVTLFQVKFKLAESKVVESYLVEAIYSSYYTNALGKDLPEIILRVTGKQISLRTLYRKAKKQRTTFKASQKLTRKEVEQWLEWATA